jgi:hypothetical protein
MQPWWCARRAKQDRAAIGLLLVKQCASQRDDGVGKMWERLLVDFDNAPAWPEPEPTRS